MLISFLIEVVLPTGEPRSDTPWNLDNLVSFKDSLIFYPILSKTKLNRAIDYIFSRTEGVTINYKVKLNSTEHSSGKLYWTLSQVAEYTC